MAERPRDWKGDAFLLVNSYTTVPTSLQPLIQIDEAIRDFWETFHALHIWPVVRWNLTKDELYKALGLWDVTLSRQATKFVVFYFIGHGGHGDVLFMEDGEPVTTEEIVAKFRPLPKEIYKFFFIDACRRTDEWAQPSDRAYCPSLENSLLARSALPYQAAYTGGTYGIWSKNLLTLLRANRQSLHETLQLVDRIVKQPTQYTYNSVPDVFWAREGETSGDNLQSSMHALPDGFHSLSEQMWLRRENEGIRSRNQALDASSKETAKASVSTLKRSPADEGAPSTKRRGAEEGTSPKVTYAQVIDEQSQRFLQEMNSQAIAPKLRALGLIPESVKNDIKESTCKEDANECLLTYLKEDATEKQVCGIFKVTSEKTEYGRMSEFAADMRQKLPQVTYAQVIDEQSQRFLQEMNSQAIAPTLRTLGLIPESVKNDVKRSTCREDANAHLLTYLKEDATEEMVHEIFKFTSEKTEYGRMSEFAADMRQKLSQGDAMAEASNPPHNPSPQSTAVSPPAPTGEIAAAGSLGATDKQTKGSLVITHATDVIEALERQVDGDWQHFGSYLRFDSTLINTIDADNRRSTDCMLALVTKWVNKDEGTGELPRTWQTVVEAVKSSGHKQLARDLAEKYKVTISW